MGKKYKKIVIMGYNMSTRMELKKEKKKKVMLDAAEKIIAENGFRDMTMDQVANEADVAKGTLYLYFKNKGGLCAAVNAKINKEMNDVIKEKMDLCQTGSEKVVASGTAVIEFSLKNPQKWNVITELHQMEFEDLEDPNVQEFLHEVNNMIQLLTEAYRQGIDEGTIRKDIDPVATSIFNRMAFSNAINLATEQKMLLELNNISQEHYLNVAWSLINRSTHIKPSIRVDPKNVNSLAEIGKEMKSVVDSLGLQARNAIEIIDAFDSVTQIMTGKFEYGIINATEDRVVAHITNCPILSSSEMNIPLELNYDICPKYGASVVETLNSKYTFKFTKKICKGDPYCECIIELKNNEAH
jgi:AcrR family transcriptional regulator